MSTELHKFLPGVLLDGIQHSSLTDSLVSTCMVLSNRYFLTRSVATFVLKKLHMSSVDVLVHGRGLQCELPLKRCRSGFTTAVFQQGRTNHSCTEQPSPCPRAETCTPLGMTSQTGNMVICHYRCRCPISTDPEDIPCNTILFSIGSGSRSDIGEEPEICSINVD